MTGFVLRRTVQAIASLTAASLAVFLLVRLSGDPIELLVAADATPQEIAETRQYYGLDRPWPEQYGMFITHAVQGDFGRSLRFKRPALEVVAERYPATLQLGGLAFLLAVATAIPLGVTAAVNRGRALDYAARTFAALGQAAPPFFVGLVLVLVVGVMLRILPTSGAGTPAHLILPALTLAWYATAGLMRLTRSSMLNVLGTEYVKLARIKGLPERTVIWKHAFHNAALPVLTFGAILLVYLINGSVVVEMVFAWPGVGSLLIEAVQNRDYPIVQVVVLLLCAIYLGASLVVDMLYAYLDPRIRIAS